MIPAGFEPTTHSLEGCCSIQLSYGTILKYLHFCYTSSCLSLYYSLTYQRITVAAPCTSNLCGAKVSKIYRFTKFLLLLGCNFINYILCAIVFIAQTHCVSKQFAAQFVAIICLCGMQFLSKFILQSLLLFAIIECR